MNTRKILLSLVGCTAVAMLSACSTAGSSNNTQKTLEIAKKDPAKTVEKAGELPAAEEAKTEAKAKEVQTAKVIKQQSKTSKKGTFVRAIVNNVPITNNDVKKRVAFMRLRRVKGGNSDAALQELIEQQLKLQEARRTNSVAADAQVNAAFANFAKNNKVPENILARELGRMGITAKHFKNYIRGQMSWNRTVGRRFSAETRQVSEKDAIFKLKETGGQKAKTTEYLVKQIVFVIPKAQLKSKLAARRAEATAMRQRFTSCDQAVALAKELRDVSIIDRGRVLEPELPPEWKTAVVSTPVNSTTKPLNTSKGVELIAICGKRDVSDDHSNKVLSQSKAFEDFNKSRGTEEEKKYYKELQERARIIIR